MHLSQQTAIYLYIFFVELVFVPGIFLLFYIYNLLFLLAPYLDLPCFRSVTPCKSKTPLGDSWLF